MDLRRQNNLTAEQRSRIGKLGGLSVSKNSQHMAEIGRRGGQSISQNKSHMSKIGQIGGSKGKGTPKTHKDIEGSVSIPHNHRS